MAGSLLLLLPFGFSSLPLPTEVFPSASVRLRFPYGYWADVAVLCTVGC